MKIMYLISYTEQFTDEVKSIALNEESVSTYITILIRDVKPKSIQILPVKIGGLTNR